MDITYVQIDVKESSRSGCVAIAAITIDGVAIVDFIKIIAGKNGLLVQWPKAFTIMNEDTKKEFANRILATYVINHCEDKCSENQK